MVLAQFTSTGHHRCQIHYEKRILTRVQSLTSPLPLVSLIHIFPKATSDLTYERLHIVLEKILALFIT